MLHGEKFVTCHEGNKEAESWKFKWNVPFSRLPTVQNICWLLQLDYNNNYTSGLQGTEE